jgi:hypothetical protein
MVTVAEPVRSWAVIRISYSTIEVLDRARLTTQA